MSNSARVFYAVAIAVLLFSDKCLFCGNSAEYVIALAITAGNEGLMAGDTFFPNQYNC